MPLHNAFAVRYGPSTVISGLSQLDLQTGANVEAETASGTPFPQFAIITGQDPRIMFATRQVAALLGITGLTGAIIDSTNNLIAFFAQLGGNGIALTTNVHRSYTSTRGLLVPRRLQCAAQGNAQIDCEALLYSLDGVTHPIAIADNVGLPVTVQNNILHTIGPISLGIAGQIFTFQCPQSISIDFGSGASTLGCGGDLYKTHMQQPRIAPVISITGIDAAAFGPGGVPPVGAPLDHANTKIFLRKRRTNGVGFVPDATAEHIRMTANGVAVVKSHTGQGTDKAEVAIEITTAWDGLVAPITFNVTAPIAP